MLPLCRTYQELPAIQKAGRHGSIVESKGCKLGFIGFGAKNVIIWENGISTPAQGPSRAAPI